MAVLRCDFYSGVLGESTSMSVILPEVTSPWSGPAAGAGGAASSVAGFPTLYLLPGLGDDDGAWLRRTSIDRYAAALGVAVVMPQVGTSFCADEVHGNRYWTFLDEELPAVANRFFRLSPRREDTFVAGLSMGGYGALKWALRNPVRFAAAASLSGSLDIADPDRYRRRPELMDRIFGGRPVAGTPDDLLWLLERAAPAAAEPAESAPAAAVRPESEAPAAVPVAGPPPALYVACGAEDSHLAENERFVDAARAAGVPVTAAFGPGEHDWAYWDRTIQDVLAWLPLPRAET